MLLHPSQSEQTNDMENKGFESNFHTNKIALLILTISMKHVSDNQKLNLRNDTPIRKSVMGSIQLQMEPLQQHVKQIPVNVSS